MEPWDKCVACCWTLGEELYFVLLYVLNVTLEFVLVLPVPSRSTTRTLLCTTCCTRVAETSDNSSEFAFRCASGTYLEKHSTKLQSWGDALDSARLEWCPKAGNARGSVQPSPAWWCPRLSVAHNNHCPVMPAAQPSPAQRPGPLPAGVSVRQRCQREHNCPCRTGKSSKSGTAGDRLLL